MWPCLADYDVYPVFQDSLCHLVDVLAALKLNRLHLFQRFGAAGTQLPFTGP